MPYPLTPCGRATSETILWLFQGRPTCRVGRLWPSSTLWTPLAIRPCQEANSDHNLIIKNQSLMNILAFFFSVGTDNFFDCLGKDAGSDFVPQVSTNPANLANLADEFVSCSFPDSVSSSSQTPSRDDGASSSDASSCTFLSHEDFDVDISNSSHFLSSSDLLADSIITIPESGSVQVPQLFNYHHHPFSTLDLAAFQSIWTPVQIEPPEKPDLLQQVVASTIFAAVTVTEPATVTVTSTEPATVTVTSTEPAQITSTQTAEPASLHSSASVPLSGHMTPGPMASGDMTSGPMTCIERFHPYAQKPVETSPARKRRKGQTTETTTTTTMPSKKLKKKEQNKTAANRYR
jgi:hypothetical protein